MPYGLMEVGMKNKALSVVLITFSLIWAQNSQAALVSRLNGQAVYDDVNNISWISTSRLAQTNSFGLPVNVEFGYNSSSPHSLFINSDGYVSWAAAGLFVSRMNASTYLGFSDWSIPYITPFCDGCSSQYFALNDSLKAVSYSSPFSSLGRVWANNLYPSSLPFYAYYYSFTPYGNSSSGRGVDYTNTLLGVLAYRTGDVLSEEMAPVPIPSSAWLMLSGLGGLAFIKRKRNCIGYSNK